MASSKGSHKAQKARKHAASASVPRSLPKVFADWFKAKGWQVRDHQWALLEAAQARRSSLLIAPTGAGKTLASFLPSLISLSGHSHMPNRASGTPEGGLHTLYISPLKALAVDVARNLVNPVAEMGLSVRTETRTGDTPANRRTRQRQRPPDMLLTTPEQLSLLLAHEDAAHFFANLDTIILDELHAISGSKRGDLLSLDLAHLRTLAPRMIAFGLSATVARPSELRAFLQSQDDPERKTAMADVIIAPPGAAPEIDILELDEPVPWSGHSARYAIESVYKAIKAHKLSLVFVNTRMQAELVFQELWRINDGDLRIALHHGSLDVGRRRKVEAAMAAGALDGVVATSTLDLGIDWGDVDLVIHVGAPKGASRLAQRIGRSNHRLDEPSRAILVPSNRFEVLECRAALDAAKEGVQDVVLSRNGSIDVLAQHVLGMACKGPFSADQLFAQVRTAAPYTGVDRETFARTIDFVATGGYALRSYERFARLRQMPDGRYRIAHPRFIQQYRMNAGTIIDNPKIKIRLIKPRGGGKNRVLMGGRVLGEVEEAFVDQLSPGDTFVFAGEVVRFEGLRETEAFVSKAATSDPKIPSYVGGKFPLSTHLAQRVRAMLAEPESWTGLPDPVREWLELHAERSALPDVDEVLVETFPHANKHYMAIYPFEGRLAHQTLGFLLTKRLQRVGARPLGFVANDYGLAVWSVNGINDLIRTRKFSLDELFRQDMLGDDLDAWLAESSLMKRTFRHAAVISGLIQRRHPGAEKSGRQVTISTDLIYDVLRRHDPGHILLEAAWADAATGLLDIARLSEFLARIQGRIRHQDLDRVSPLSVPILLEIGKEPVQRSAREDLLRDAADALVREATHGDGHVAVQAGTT